MTISKAKLNNVSNKIAFESKIQSDFSIEADVKDLSETKKYDYSFYEIPNTSQDGKPRFQEFEIASLIEVLKQYPKAATLIEAKKANGDFRFKENEIKSIAPLLDEYSEECAYLMGLKYPDGSFRLGGKTIAMLTPITKKHPELVTKIVEDKKNEKEFRFCEEDIKHIGPLIKKYPDAVNLLLNSTWDNGEYNFSSRDIKALAPVISDSVSIFEEFINLKNSKGLPELSTMQLLALGETIKEFPKETRALIDLKDENGRRRIENYNIESLAPALNKHPIEMLSLLNLKNPDGTYIYNEQKISTLSYYVNNYPIKKEFLNIVSYVLSQDYAQDIENIIPKKKFSSDYISLVNFKEGIPYGYIRKLTSEDGGKEEFLDSIKNLFFVYKVAANRPEKYLNYEERKNKNAEQQKNAINDFFESNLSKLLRVAQYLDTDTINQMMDKKFISFAENLDNLDKISQENMEIISKLIKCKTHTAKKNGKDFSDSELKEGRVLTAEEKITICEIVKLFQDSNSSNETTSLSIDLLKNMAKSGFVNIPKLKQKIAFEIFKKANIEVKDIKDIYGTKGKLNEQYFFTLLNSSEELGHFEVIREALMGNFENFIHDTKNPYGKANQITKNIFKKKKLNHQNWIKPTIGEKNVTVANEQMTIKIWDRNPLEDLFIGNKTTCCIATNGLYKESITQYLTNEFFNFIEVKNSKDETVGSIRIFFVEIDEKPALILDSFEINNSYAKNVSQDDLMLLRNSVFEYAKDFANSITKETNTPMYLSYNNIDIDTKDLQLKQVAPSILGSLSNYSVYLNSEINPYGKSTKSLYFVS